MSTAKTGLIVRALPPEEWGKLSEVYERHGGQFPAASLILVVEDGDEIVGSVDLMTLPVVGLMHVAQGRRGEGIASLLSATVESLCGDGDTLFTVTNSPQTAEMAERRGWTKLDGEVWGRSY